MKRYVQYLCNEMERLAIDVRLNTEASVNLIKSLEPYAVILATGGIPHVPDIEGYDLPNVCNYRAVKLEESALCNKKIVVIGSGMVCHSTTRRLIEAGNDVTLVEMFTKTGSKISPTTRGKLLEKLTKLGVEVITNHHVLKIVPNGAIVEANESKEKFTVKSDHVVIAMGVQAYNPLEKSLKKEMDHVFVIGDAAGHTSLADATGEGFETAYRLESLVSSNN